jgi:hypothetical protein
MSDKQQIIQQMMDMQNKFIEMEQNGEFSAEDYYDTEGDSELARHKREFEALATQLVDMAHEEKGSHR